MNSPSTQADPRYAVPGAAAQVRHDIDRALDRRATRPNTTARRFEDGAKTSGKAAWGWIKRHPYLGVAASVAAGVTAAATVGVGEIAVGATLGYAAYKVLRRGERADQAIDEILEDLGHS